MKAWNAGLSRQWRIVGPIQYSYAPQRFVAGVFTVILLSGFCSMHAASLLSSTNTVDTTPPTTPTNLTAVVVTARKVVLTWGAAKDDSGSVTYTLQRDGTVLKGSLTSTNYTDLQVQPGTTYAYQVQAVDPTGNKSPFTPELSVTTPAEQLVDTPGLLFEAWAGLTDLSALAQVSEPPDYRALATAADSQTVYVTQTLTNYGARLSGFVVPKDTGKYEFFVRSKDSSELWLSPTDQPADLVPVAEETVCCQPFQETGDPGTSGPITLVAGRKYAIQVLWSTATDPGYAQVAWRKVGDLTPSGALYPIPGDFLITSWDASVGPPTITSKSMDFPAPGTNAVMQVEASGDVPITYQWARYGQSPIPGATNSSLILTNVAVTNIGSIYTVQLANAFGPGVAYFALVPNGTLFVEGEDFNFGAGQYVKDQPIGVTGPYPGGSYYGEGTAADQGIDYNGNSSNGTDYRRTTLVAAGQPNQQSDGPTRGEFDVQVNHVVTPAQEGEWYNYARLFPTPAREYYVFGRFAPSTGTNLVQLDEITSGATTTNQVLKTVGEFRPKLPAATTNRFATVPLVDAAGHFVTITNWAGEKTFRITIKTGTPDFDYVFFVSTTPVPTAPPEFTSVTREGNNLVLEWTTGTLESAPTVNGPWTPVLNASSPYTVPATGPMEFYRLQ
jgi:hypothetical protein